MNAREYIECPVCKGTGQNGRRGDDFGPEDEFCYQCEGLGKVRIPPFPDLGDQTHWAKPMTDDIPCGLSLEDVEDLAIYWHECERYETLGMFIQRVGARVLQNLQLAAGRHG